MFKPYTIWLPEYSIVSGGIRVMYGLYAALLLKGQIVNPNAIYQGINSIAIYPEIAQGNPLNGSTVVRYILNKPGVMASNGVPGPTEFDKDDILYTFSKIFMKTDKLHQLFLPILDMHLFHDMKKPRTKTCYFIGKGENQFKHPKDAIELNRGIAGNQEYLANALNECQTLYCYDPVTAMTEIARLCGTKVRMYNDKYSKQDFAEYEPGMNGITWGDEDEVPLEYHGFRQHYSWMKGEFMRKMDDFIKETQA